MQTTDSPATKPNGPVVASFLAAGIGFFTMGITVVLNEVSPEISDFLKFDANFGLGSGVGSLSGKATISILAFLASWLVLGLLFRGKEVRFGPAFTVALILVAGGFLLTFPPVFGVFAQ